MSELSPSYMTARKALRELKAQFDNLPTPSIPAQPNWSHREDRQAVDQWKRYFAWEEANPLEFEDTSALQHRVTYAYKKATAHLRFFTEIWYVVRPLSVPILLHLLTSNFVKVLGVSIPGQNR